MSFWALLYFVFFFCWLLMHVSQWPNLASHISLSENCKKKEKKKLIEMLNWSDIIIHTVNGYKAYISWNYLLPSSDHAQQKLES